MHESSYQNVVFDYEITDDFVTTVRYQRCTQECQSFSFDFEYKYYDAFEGEGQKDGVYIFRDQGAGAASKSYSKVVDHHVYKGDIASVLYLHGDTVDARVVVNNYAAIPYASVTSIVHGIEDGWGKEVTVNFRTPEIQSDRFFTDSNGMIMEERILNHRENFELSNLTGFEVVSNFYPVNAAITLKDGHDQFTVLNDRAQAGASLNPGEVELLVHRRSRFDDDRGVYEPLNETLSDGTPISVQVEHQVISAPIGSLNQGGFSEVKKLQRFINEEPLQVFFSGVPSSFSLPKSQVQFPVLPVNVKLVMKTLSPSRIMLRLYNMNEAFDNLSSPTPVDFSQIVSYISSVAKEDSFSVTEWNLSLNTQVGKSERINWKVQNGKATYDGVNEVEMEESDGGFELDSQEMKSFIFEFSTTEQVIQ